MRFMKVDELAAELRSQQARSKDKIIPSSQMAFDAGNDGVVLRIGESAHLIQKQAHEQMALKLGIPSGYYNRMLKEAATLLTVNSNHWLNLETDKRRLIRFIDGEVRAFLGDRYRPINHLDILTTAMLVIIGQDGEGGQEKPYARGARILNADLTPTNLNVRLVNPAVYVDLDHLDRGVVTDSPEEDEIQRRIFRRGLASDRTDWGNSIVYPSSLIRNSETGHGGLEIQPGLTEGFCTNCNWYGKGLQQRHLGKTLEMDDDLSPETYKKMNAVIFSKAQDLLRMVFEPDRFLVTCKKFKGLQEVEIDIKDALDNIVAIPGMTEGIRDDIFAKYSVYKANGGRKTDNLFDLNRAVTEVAQDCNDPDRALALETLGGEMIEGGRLALSK